MARDGEQRKRAPRGRARSGATRETTPTSRLPELLRRGLSLGFAGLFMTEEAVRKALGDTVPKDWMDFAVDQSERTRAEFIERLAGEIARSLETIDIAELVDRVVEGRTIEVKAQFRVLGRPASSRSAKFTLSMLDGRKKRK